MIIAIDGNEANVCQRVGVNQFAYETMWGLYRGRAKKDSQDDYRIFLRQPPLPDFPPEKNWWQYEIFGPARFWTWTGLVRRLFGGRPKPDVLFCPSHYGPLFSPIPFVISVMDLGFLFWPEQFRFSDYCQLKYGTSRSVKKASRIIVISNFTKEQVCRTYHLNPEKIVVAHPGYQKTKNEKNRPSLPLPNSTLKKFHLKKGYLLFLSTLKPSKNIEGLLEAYEILKSERLENLPPLVIAGKKGWLYEQIFAKVKSLSLQDNVVFTDFVPDDEVSNLLKNASVFTLPSYFEGFGIPILEAMAAGVPVVCSRAGSLPEIAGNAAVLVDPFQPRDIALGIKSVLTDQEKRAKLISAGKKRVRLFSWEKCSKIIQVQLKKVYEYRRKH